MLRACERQGTGDKYKRKRAEREQEYDMEQTRKFLFLGVGGLNWELLSLI